MADWWVGSVAKESDVRTKYEGFTVRVGTTNSRDEVLKEIRRALGLIFFDVEVSD